MTGLRYDYFHISTLPRLHHIVWCRLPEDGDLTKPGSTVRPALVRGSKRDPANGRGALQVSYGTTQLQINQCGPVDLIIQNAARLAQLDLPMAVRFDLGLANWLPWASEFFAPPAHSLYIVAGPLTEQERTFLRKKLERRGALLKL
jgi:hypothetical protein